MLLVPSPSVPSLFVSVLLSSVSSCLRPYGRQHRRTIGRRDDLYVRWLIREDEDSPRTGRFVRPSPEGTTREGTLLDDCTGGNVGHGRNRA